MCNRTPKPTSEHQARSSCQQLVFLPGKLFLIENSGKFPANPYNVRPSALGICPLCSLCVPFPEHVAIPGCPCMFTPHYPYQIGSSFWQEMLSVFAECLLCLPRSFLHPSPKACPIWSTTCSQVPAFQFDFDGQP